MWFHICWGGEGINGALINRKQEHAIKMVPNNKGKKIGYKRRRLNRDRWRKLVSGRD